MTEVELKLEIPPTSLKRVSAALRAGKTSRQRLRAVYFDTADGALARHGVVVRQRKEGGQWVQTAKGPSSSLVERLEHNVTLALAKTSATSDVDLTLHAATLVGKAIESALNVKAGEASPPLTAIYETEILRITRIAEFDGSLVELAFDRGYIMADGQSLDICELEIELKEGLPEHAVALARQWCAEYGLWLSSITKSMKGQRLRGENSTNTAVTATAPTFARNATGGQIVQAVIQSCLRQILPNASELASGQARGSDAADLVHQLRVGIRRLRTALRELRELSDELDPLWEKTLADVFRQLGRHRDHNQLEHTLQPRLEAAGGPPLTFGQANRAALDPGTVVRNLGFQDCLLCLIGFTHRVAPARSEQPSSTRSLAKEILTRRLKKLHSQVQKDGKQFLALTDEQQHRVRKRLKRLRYLAEFCAPFFPHRKTNAFIAALKPAQDALGLYIDELIALNVYRVMAVENERASFGLGWLTARRLPQAKRCRKEINALAKAHAFWD